MSELSIKRRLLIITNTGTLRGASLGLLSLLRGIPCDRWEPIVVLSEEGPLHAELKRLGVKVISIYQPWWVTGGTTDAWLYAMRLLPKAVEDIRQVIRTEKIDLVFTNTSVTPAGAIAAALEGRPHFWYAQEFIRGLFTGGALDSRTVHGCMAALSSLVLANSRALATEITTETGAKVEVLYSPVDCEYFENCRPNSASGRIVSIGTVTPEKGLDDLVEAAGVLKQRGLSFCIAIVGDFEQDDYKRSIVKRLEMLGIAEQFSFINYQKDIRPFLNGASIYCCPSHSEGMSRTIVEAMAAGLPVVATACGGPADLVLDGTTGRLVPVRSPAMLTAALAEYQKDSERGESHGAAGRKRASDLFDVNVAVPPMVRSLEQALSSPPASSAVPLAEWLVSILQLGGPRMLLGKKWRLMKGIVK